MTMGQDLPPRAQVDNDAFAALHGSGLNRYDLAPRLLLFSARATAEWAKVIETYPETIFR
jgi:hypothetical protein